MIPYKFRNHHRTFFFKPLPVHSKDGGVVAEILGDGLLVYWNTPLDVEVRVISVGASHKNDWKAEESVLYDNCFWSLLSSAMADVARNEHAKWGTTLVATPK